MSVHKATGAVTVTETQLPFLTILTDYHFIVE